MTNNNTEGGGPTPEQLEAAHGATQEFTWLNDDQWVNIIANLLAQREQSSYNRGVRDGLEKAAVCFAAKAGHYKRLSEILNEGYNGPYAASATGWANAAKMARTLMGDE